MIRKIELFMSLALLCCAIFLAREGARFMLRNSRNPISSDTSHSFESDQACSETTDIPNTHPLTNPITIVIDAGHGGSDPGKIGCNDILEKDINLSIALLLKESLEAKNITIVLTRETDNNLASEGSPNQKRSDMQNRCEIIRNANPIFTVSIHQNSYPSPEVSGAQVFYYKNSTEGNALATTLQTALKNGLNPENHRQPKANDSYYLLKKTPTPTVIVECGFLSNPSEAMLLSSNEYQQKVVDALTLGILTYLQETLSFSPSAFTT